MTRCFTQFCKILPLLRVIRIHSLCSALVGPKRVDFSQKTMFVPKSGVCVPHLGLPGGPPFPGTGAPLESGDRNRRGVKGLMGRRGGRGKWRVWGWAHRAPAGSGSTARRARGCGGGDSLEGKTEEQSLAPRAARAL